MNGEDITLKKPESKEWTLIAGNGLVRLQIDHRTFGILKIDEFQRKLEEIQTYETGIAIKWQSQLWKIVKADVIEKEEWEELGRPYTMVFVTIEEETV